jgi:exopolysaccharide biosynthesis polyprenyl glycosylphosphotransferase
VVIIGGALATAVARGAHPAKDEGLIRRYVAPLKVALMLSDGLSAAFLFLVIVALRIDVLDGTWSLARLKPLELAIAYGVMCVGVLWFMGLYRLRTHWTLRGEITGVLRAVALLLVISLSVLYIFNLSNVSRLLLAFLFVAQPVVTITSRVALRYVLERARRSGRLRREIVVVGAGPEAQLFADMVEAHREFGLHVAGHLRAPNDPAPLATRRIIGDIDEIEHVLRTQVVDEVAVCLSPNDWSYVEPVTRMCEDQGKIVRVSIRSLGGVLSGGQVEEVADMPIVSFVYGPDRFLSMAFKRGFDVAVSAALLILASPIVATVAFALLVLDGRPVLFHQKRVGLHGRIFSCLKFRTMVRDAEERQAEVAHLNEIRGAAFKIRNDPRITRTGRFLRATSLDELPQLWNVLRGDMSLVGPRPAPPREVEKYSLWHRRRLSMRPGLTGLWQVSARNEVDFDRRVSVDLDYIDRWSLWMDVKIVLRTIPAVVAHEGR